MSSPVSTTSSTVGSWNNSIASAPTSPQYYHYQTSPITTYSVTSNSTPVSPVSSTNRSTAYLGDKEEDQEDKLYERQMPNPHAMKLLERVVTQQQEPEDMEIRKRDRERKRASELKALTMLAISTAGDDSRLANTGEQEIQTFKSHDDIIRQKAAGNQALNILHNTVMENRRRADDLEFQRRNAHSLQIVPTYTEDYGGGIDLADNTSIAKAGGDDASKPWASAERGQRPQTDKPKTSSVASGKKNLESLAESCRGSSEPRKDRRMTEMKTPTDLAREREAQAKALRLSRMLKETEKVKKDKETFGRRAPKLCRTEDLAESSRVKSKRLTPEDVRDPETIAGMKYQIHWDREKIAQAKALRLLNQLGI